MPPGAGMKGRKRFDWNCWQGIILVSELEDYETTSHSFKRQEKTEEPRWVRFPKKHFQISCECSARSVCARACLGFLAPQKTGRYRKESSQSKSCGYLLCMAWPVSIVMINWYREIERFFLCGYWPSPRNIMGSVSKIVRDFPDFTKQGWKYLEICSSSFDRFSLLKRDF